MNYAQHIDYPNGVSTLGSNYTAGSGSFAVAAGEGVKFGTPTAANPVRFTAAVAATPTTCTHYSCTGRSTDTLTGVTVLSGTDRNYSAGDSIFASVYAEDLNDIQVSVAGMTAAFASRNLVM